MKYLAFDTESTGFPYNKERLCELNPAVIPHIIQLSCVLFNETGKILELYNTFIKIPTKIPDFITDLTGIHQYHVDNYGVSIETALQRALEIFKQADILVAHNIGFDLRMLFLELWRLKEKEKDEEEKDEEDEEESWIDEFDDLLETKNVYCTMHSTTAYCNIIRTNCRGFTFVKVPKSIELYEILFGNLPQNIQTHNAIIDTLMCMRCFCKYELKIDVEEYDFFMEKYSKLVGRNMVTRSMTKEMDKKRKFSEI